MNLTEVRALVHDLNARPRTAEPTTRERRREQDQCEDCGTPLLFHRGRVTFGICPRCEPNTRP